MFRKKKTHNKACIKCVHIFMCGGDEDPNKCILYEERLNQDDKKDIDKKIKEAGE